MSDEFIPTIRAADVEHEVERLQALGFPKEDIEVEVKDALNAFVSVPTFNRETGTKQSLHILSHVIIGREPNGNPIRGAA